MTKLELLYQELLKREVVRYKEIEEIASEIVEKQPVSFRYLYNEYINKLRRSGKLLHPQRGTYVVVPPTKINEKSFQPDTYLIASKIQKPYYLGYHTALELHGCAYSSYNEAYIVVPPNKKFRGFEFKNIRYRPVFSSQSQIGLQQINHKNHKIVVSSPSRTFLDCIERPEYAGEWEECLKSLESLAGVKANELKQLLDKIGKDMLFRKTGLILNLFNENPYYEGLLSNLKPYLTEKMGKSPMYLKEGAKSELDKNWRLYVPIGFKDVIRGV
jgi:predicted transcriptional regulator of viral defense system